MTASTNQRPSLAQVNLDVPCSHRLIELGNAHKLGVFAIHRAARKAILGTGRVALFIGANGEAAACSYRHVDYDRHCRKHAESLVGVYEPSRHGDISDAADQALLADIRCHVLALPTKGAKAA